MSRCTPPHVPDYAHYQVYRNGNPLPGCHFREESDAWNNVQHGAGHINEYEVRLVSGPCKPPQKREYIVLYWSVTTQEWLQYAAGSSLMTEDEAMRHVSGAPTRRVMRKVNVPDGPLC